MFERRLRLRWGLSAPKPPDQGASPLDPLFSFPSFFSLLRFLFFFLFLSLALFLLPLLLPHPILSFVGLPISLQTSIRCDALVIQSMRKDPMQIQQTQSKRTSSQSFICIIIQFSRGHTGLFKNRCTSL